jgi:hypothetical protein
MKMIDCDNLCRDVITSLSKALFKVEFLDGGIPREVAAAWERKFRIRSAANAARDGAVAGDGRWTPAQYNAAIKVQRAWRSIVLWKRMQAQFAALEMQKQQPLPTQSSS